MSFTTEVPGVAGLPRRDVRVIALALGLIYLTDFMVTTTVLLRLHDRGASGLAVSGLMLVSALTLVITAPVTGALTDRVDSRVLLAIAGTTQMVAGLALAWAQQTMIMLGLVAVLTLGLGLAGPTLSALVPAIVAAEDLARANGLVASITTLGLVLGPGAGGLLTGLYGSRIPMLVGAGFGALFTLIGLAVRARRNVDTGARTTGGTLTGVRLLRADPVLSWMLLLSTITILLLQITNVFEVFLVRDTLRASATMFGVVGAVWAGGMFAGSRLAGSGVVSRAIRTDSGMARWALVATGLQAVSLTAVAAAPGIFWLVPIFAIGGAGNGALNVFRQTWFGRRAPEHARGRVFSTANALYNVAAVTALALGGLLTGLIQARAAYAVCGSLCLLVTVGFAVHHRPAGLDDRRGVQPGGHPSPSAAKATDTYLYRMQ